VLSLAGHVRKPIRLASLSKRFATRSTLLASLSFRELVARLALESSWTFQDQASQLALKQTDQAKARLPRHTRCILVPAWFRPLQMQSKTQPLFVQDTAILLEHFASSHRTTDT
jgi:hypothetical protein